MNYRTINEFLELYKYINVYSMMSVCVFVFWYGLEMFACLDVVFLNFETKTKIKEKK